MAQDSFDAVGFPAGDWGHGGYDGVGFYTGGTLGSGTAILTGTASAFGDPIQAQLDGQALTLSAYAELPGGIVLTTPDFTTFYVFTTDGFDPQETYPLTYAFSSFAAPCFLAGTRIATDRGEVPVEALQTGDRVVALRGMRFAAVVWLGHRRLDCRGLYRGQDVWPVRIAAHAFAPDQPRRDLLLSPDHAVFVDGGLIPVRYLLNGASITQAPMRDISYWHVELSAHDVLLAEGLPAESYLDTGNRGQFDGPAARRSALGGIGKLVANRVWQQMACAPLRLAPSDHEPVRRRLLARAHALGHVTSDDPALQVYADGVAVPVIRDGWQFTAELPPGAVTLRIATRSAVPAQVVPDSVDHRRLGVAITALTLDGQAVDPACFGGGWCAPEPGFHWTDGDAELRCDPPARVLALCVAPLLRYWLPDDPPARLAA